MATIKEMSNKLKENYTYIQKLDALKWLRVHFTKASLPEMIEAYNNTYDY